MRVRTAGMMILAAVSTGLVAPTATASPTTETLSAWEARTVIRGYRSGPVAAMTGYPSMLGRWQSERIDDRLETEQRANSAAVARNLKQAGLRGAFDLGWVHVSVDDIAVNGSTATVQTTDRVELHQTGRPLDLSGTTSETAQRTYTFERRQGRWVLVGARDKVSASVQANSEAGAATADLIDPAPAPRPLAPRAAPLDSTSTVAALGGASIQRTYNPTAAVAYARKHVTNHNTYAYPTYPNADCTNFASQVLNAGGMRQRGRGIYKSTDSRAWYYHDTVASYPTIYQAKPSRSWINAQSLATFLSTNPTVATRYKDWRNAKVGDVVSFQWPGYDRISHTAVVTGISPYYGPLVTYHTEDKLNYPLLYIMYRDPGTTMTFFSIK